MKPRLRGPATVLALTLAASTPLWTPSAAQAVDPDPATLAAGLLNRDARQQDEPIRMDVGRLSDRLLSFAAAGSNGEAADPGRAWYLLDALEKRASFADGSTTTSAVDVSGQALPAVKAFDDLARATFTAEVYGQDAHDFADRDLLAELRTAFDLRAIDPRFHRLGGREMGDDRVEHLGSRLDVLLGVAEEKPER